MLLSADGNNGSHVSMYDFQYVGKAPPSIDLAYFFCVKAACGGTNNEFLAFYHNGLVSQLWDDGEHPSLKELEDSLSLAFCGFRRFMSICPLPPDTFLKDPWHLLLGPVLKIIRHLMNHHWHHFPQLLPPV